MHPRITRYPTVFRVVGTHSSKVWDASPRISEVRSRLDEYAQNEDWGHVTEYLHPNPQSNTCGGRASLQGASSHNDSSVIGPTSRGVPWRRSGKGGKGRKGGEILAPGEVLTAAAHEQMTEEVLLNDGSRMTVPRGLTTWPPPTSDYHALQALNDQALQGPNHQTPAAFPANQVSSRQMNEAPTLPWVYGMPLEDYVPWPLTPAAGLPEAQSSSLSIRTRIPGWKSSTWAP